MSQTAVQGPSVPDQVVSAGEDDTSSVKAPGKVTALPVMFTSTTRRSPGAVRSQASTPARERSHPKAPSRRAGDRRRAARARRYRCRNDPGSASWAAASAVSASGGQGSHGLAVAQPWSGPALHGIGARQPSRPPGSTLRSAGMTALLSPSSSPA